MPTEEFVFECDEKADEGGGPGKFTVPVGEYALTVWEVIPADNGKHHPKLGAPWRISRNGDPQLNIKFGVNGHPGIWVFNTMTFIPKNAAGHGIIVHSLKALGAVIKDGRLINFRAVDLIGKVCRAKLLLEQPEGSKYPRNKVDKIDYPQDGDMPEMPVAKAPTENAAEDTEEVPF